MYNNLLANSYLSFAPTLSDFLIKLIMIIKVARFLTDFLKTIIFFCFCFAIFIVKVVIIITITECYIMPFSYDCNLLYAQQHNNQYYFLTESRQLDGLDYISFKTCYGNILNVDTHNNHCFTTFLDKKKQSCIF